LKRFGKFKKISNRLLPKGLAIKTGALEAKRTLGATFKIIEKGTTSLEDINFNIDEAMFRDYKIVKGKRVYTPGTFIQRKGKRLSARSEIGEIQIAKRRSPRLTNKRMKEGIFNGRYY